MSPLTGNTIRLLTKTRKTHIIEPDKKPHSPPWVPHRLLLWDPALAALHAPSHTQKMDEDYGHINSFKCGLIYLKAKWRMEEVAKGSNWWKFDHRCCHYYRQELERSSWACQLLGFHPLPFLKELEDASLLPSNGSAFTIQLSSPSHSKGVKRWHSALVFRRVIFLCLSSQEKQLAKLGQCTVTNALEMPTARQP